MKDLETLRLAFHTVGVPFLLAGSKESTNLCIGDSIHFTFDVHGEFVSVSDGKVVRNKVTPLYVQEDVREPEPPKAREFHVWVQLENMSWYCKGCDGPAADCPFNKR